MEERWNPDLGSPFGVMYCIRCECIAVSFFFVHFLRSTIDDSKMMALKKNVVIFIFICLFFFVHIWKDTILFKTVIYVCVLCVRVNPSIVSRQPKFKKERRSFADVMIVRFVTFFSWALLHFHRVFFLKKKE